MSSRPPIGTTLLLAGVLLASASLGGCCCAEGGGIGKDPTTGKCYYPDDQGCQSWEHPRHEVPCPLSLDCEVTECLTDDDCRAAQPCAELLHCMKTRGSLCTHGKCLVILDDPQDCSEDIHCSSPGVCKANSCVIPLNEPCPPADAGTNEDAGDSGGVDSGAGQ